MSAPEQRNINRQNARQLLLQFDELILENEQIPKLKEELTMMKKEIISLQWIVVEQEGELGGLKEEARTMEIEGNSFKALLMEKDAAFKQFKAELVAKIQGTSVAEDKRQGKQVQVTQLSTNGSPDFNMAGHRNDKSKRSRTRTHGIAKMYPQAHNTKAKRDMKVNFQKADTAEEARIQLDAYWNPVLFDDESLGLSHQPEGPVNE